MYIATAFTPPAAQFALFMAALKQYAAPNTAIDGISEAGFATVMNVQQRPAQRSRARRRQRRSWRRSRAGSNQPNYMSHPYTCNGQAIAKAKSICNDYYLMEQIKDSQPVVANPTDWITSKGYFAGLPAS